LFFNLDFLKVLDFCNLATLNNLTKRNKIPFKKPSATKVRPKTRPKSPLGRPKSFWPEMGSNPYKKDVAPIP